MEVEVVALMGGGVHKQHYDKVDGGEVIHWNPCTPNEEMNFKAFEINNREVFNGCLMLIDNALEKKCHF
jgi:hypothetical protein